MYREKTDEKLLEELLEQGYGVDERKKWRERWLRNQKAQNDLASRRRESVSPAAQSRVREDPSAEEEKEALRRRAQDGVKIISARLRRRIDAYAYRNGYLATGFSERLRSLLSIFAPGIKDYAGRKLIRRLVDGRGFRGENPFHFCLADNLDALFYTSRFLLGSVTTARMTQVGFAEPRDADRLRREIASRDPFAVGFFTRFEQRDEMLMRSLEFIKLRFSRRARIETTSLVRVAKSIYRLLYGIGNLDPDRLTGVFSSVVAVHRARENRARQRNQIEENMGLFQIAYANLFEFRHQLFPPLLKMMGTFFREDRIENAENRFKILEYLGLEDGDMLRPPAREKSGEVSDGAGENGKAEEAALTSEDTGPGDESAAAPEGEERPEAEERPPFARRFKRELATFRYLFPGSGIREMDSWPCFLPYFDLKVYSKDLTFSNLVSKLSRLDPMGQIMVLHRIVDNLITSLEIYCLDEILAKRGQLAAQLSDIIIEWQRIYTMLFDVYLKELGDYAHMLEGSRSLGLSPMMRRLEENLNQLKNLAIQNYGKTMISVKDRIGYGDGVRLYKLAEELNDLLMALADEINVAGFRDRHPAALRLWNEMAARRVVDFKANAYKPAVGQVQKYIEAKYQTPIYRVPTVAQAEFFDVLIGSAAMYDFLLNDPQSYFHTSEGKVFVAGPEEWETWQRVRDSLAEVSFRETPGDSDMVLDRLTGLISRGYWEESLPEKQEEMASRSYAVVYAAVDEYGRLKEDFPQHDYADRLLKLASSLILACRKNLGIRHIEADAVRIDDNGLMLLVGGELSVAAPVAEDLRKAHRRKLKELAFAADVLHSRRTPCGTLSLGAAQREEGETLQETMNRAREAAAEAARAGDQVLVYSVGALIPYDDFREDSP